MLRAKDQTERLLERQRSRQIASQHDFWEAAYIQSQVVALRRAVPIQRVDLFLPRVEALTVSGIVIEGLRKVHREQYSLPQKLAY